MKKIFFIRHAKSSWAENGLSDEMRPLNNRGLRDAPFMATTLHGKNVKPDLVITSSAVRAHTTAKFFAARLEVPGDKIQVHEELYLASPREILNVVTAQDDAFSTLLVFGHNPGFTSIANLFSDDYISNVPTCGIVEVEANIEHWKDFSEATGRLKTFNYPKQYFS